jgi:RNA polymerase sigma-70 factor (ECF subfamily)
MTAVDMPPSPSSPASRAPDPESLVWLETLTASGPQREQAVERLHALLLRAARFELGRRAGAVRGGAGDRDDLAVQAADDALVAVLAKLSSYRGDSRFTTWAYKFAILEAAVKVRRRAWQGRELPLEDDAWAMLPDRSGAQPASAAESAELMAAVGEEIQRSLTGHQREVLVAIALNDVPIDVLAERLGSTRGAVYKTLHDARRKLRARLAERGLSPSPEEELP